jgi:exopolysaccharide production protein ExoQ
MLQLFATLTCLLFILFLFWADHDASNEPSTTLWVPLAWMFLAASRYVSAWLNLGGPHPAVATVPDGSPLDAAVFLILIFAGMTILIRRRVNWVELLFDNPWVWLYFLFGVLSILWSDFPFISFKRWVKAFGNVIMVLVILTEPQPYEAVLIILRRLAFLLIPLSVLFIKYYPELGRAYGWGGRVMYTGVASHKNGLGDICLLAGIYFCWSFLIKRRRELGAAGEQRWLGSLFNWSEYLDQWKERRMREKFYGLASLALIAMTAWLLYMANSATSLVCLVVAAGLLLMGSVPAVAREPRWIITLGVLAVPILGMLEVLLGVSDLVIGMVGRDPTLTTRVPMWHGLLQMAEDPILGTGFESFWSGDRFSAVLSTYGGINQAHNGYLETYLNLGLIGLALLVGSIAAGLLKVSRYLDVDYSSSILRLCFIVTIVLYNWTEASICGVSDTWVLLLFAIMDPPRQQEEE